MAAPIAHIFLAVQMLAGPLLQNEFNEKEFLIGTSFPDIRYLKVVERAETHFKDVTLDDVKRQTNSFKAGMLFHSLVDEQREEFVVKNNLYKHLQKFRFTTQTLKFAEDQILTKSFQINKYQSYFEAILDGERDFKISESHLKMWHQFLQDYFSGKLKSRDLLMKYFDMNEPNAWFAKRWFFSWYYASKIDQGIQDIIQDDETKNLILKFYLNFAATSRNRVDNAESKPVTRGNMDGNTAMLPDRN